MKKTFGYGSLLLVLLLPSLTSAQQDTSNASVVASNTPAIGVSVKSMEAENTQTNAIKGSVTNAIPVEPVIEAVEPDTEKTDDLETLQHRRYSWQEKSDSYWLFHLPEDWEFAVGTRILTVNLLSDTKGESFNNSFIGSINRLDADQDYTPIRPFVQYGRRLDNATVGFGFNYDNMAVDTLDSGGGDGQIESELWQFYVFLEDQRHEWLRPYAELGICLAQNDFAPLPDWYAGGLREFVLDDSQALYLAGGCGIVLHESWSFDFYARYIDLDVDGVYIFRGDSRDPEPFTFTLDHIAYGVGVRGTF